MRYRGLFFHFLPAFLLWIQSFAMFALANDNEPILVVRGSDNGVFDEWKMWFNGNGTSVYRLCTVWDGPWGGTPSTELFRMRGSIRNLKVGEQLQFYKASTSASVTGSDEHSAVTYTIGDGLFETVYKGPGDGDGYTRRDKPPRYSELPPSAFANASLTRTATGALLVIDGIPVVHCGEESLYFNSITPTLRITISNAELEAWDQIEKTLSASGPGMDGNGTYAYTVTITARLPDQDGEVEVEIVDFNNWIPEGNVKNPEIQGNTLKIKAKVIFKDGDKTSNDAKITFTLANVSTEPGVCINGPAAKGLDMKFIEEENYDENLTVFPKEIQTKDFVKETEVIVSSFDYGAFAELHVTAKDRDGKKLKVILQGKERTSIALPKAELGGRIADAWREKEAVEGLPDDWDAELVKGQQVNGDGLSLYEEYRGALTGRTEDGTYTRLNPKEKELFVVDEAGILNAELWKSASGIAAIFVSTKNTKGTGTAARELNWCTNYAKAGSKHAVVIDTKTKTLENNVMGEVNEGVTTPRDVTFCHVYPKTALDFVNELIHKLQIAIKNPESEDGEYFTASGLPPKLWKDALDRLGPETIDKIVALQLKWTAIHELGHACGIKGHLSMGEPQQETSLGHPQCFMRYTKSQEDAMHFLLQILFPDAKTVMGFTLFCTDGYNCMGALNVKDP